MARGLIGSTCASGWTGWTGWTIGYTDWTAMTGLAGLTGFWIRTSALGSQLVAAMTYCTLTNGVPWDCAR
jgi:hypothetical protein